MKFEYTLAVILAAAVLMGALALIYLALREYAMLLIFFVMAVMLAE